MNTQKFYIQSLFPTEHFTLPLFRMWFIIILLSVFATGNTVNAQNGLPDFADPVEDAFGLWPPSSIIPAWIRFVDIDHDDTLEAFAFSFPPQSPANGQNLDYFENIGSNEVPVFVFVETYPFGIPGNSVDFFFNFVDIDGDGLDELFFYR